MIYYTEYLSPIGKLFLTSDGINIVGLHIESQQHSIECKTFVNQDDLKVFRIAKIWLDRYFLNQKPSITDLPLSLSGTSFRHLVWKYLCEIPYGEVVTYGALAKKAAAELGKERMSAQAIGGAVGHNPISIIIPCHRVVGANGNLTGYDIGIDIKIRLLTHEGVNMEGFYIT